MNRRNNFSQFGHFQVSQFFEVENDLTEAQLV